MKADSVAPLLIGPRNCEAAIGVPWRRVRECAARHGLRPVRIGVAHAFRATELIEALEADDVVPEQEASADPVAALRARLGLKLVGVR